MRLQASDYFLSAQLPTHPMKIKSIVRSLAAIFVLGLTVSTTKAHSDEKKTAGPNGGRGIGIGLHRSLLALS
jgi:hypothetical protein